MGNGNPGANGRLCVITTFWGYLSKSYFCNQILKLDVESKNPSAVSQCFIFT